MDEMRENAVKHTVKDSLFADLFSFPEYVMDLYRTLHCSRLFPIELRLRLVLLDILCIRLSSNQTAPCGLFSLDSA